MQKVPAAQQALVDIAAEISAAMGDVVSVIERLRWYTPYMPVSDEKPVLALYHHQCYRGEMGESEDHDARVLCENPLILMNMEKGVIHAFIGKDDKASDFIESLGEVSEMAAERKRLAKVSSVKTFLQTTTDQLKDRADDLRQQHAREMESLAKLSDSLLHGDERESQLREDLRNLLLCLEKMPSNFSLKVNPASEWEATWEFGPESLQDLAVYFYRRDDWIQSAMRRSTLIQRVIRQTEEKILEIEKRIDALTLHIDEETEFQMLAMSHLQGVKDMFVKDGNLHFITNQITLPFMGYEYYLGTFEIMIFGSNLKMYVQGTGDTVGSCDWIHPHVSRDGYPCWGDMQAGYDVARDNLDILAIAQGFLNILQIYNDDSPYHSIVNWPLLKDMPAKYPHIKLTPENRERAAQLLAEEASAEEE